MSVDALTERVRSAVGRRARELGVAAGPLDVVPVPSRGGFVNRSFRVSDGRTALHIKLTDDPGGVHGLRRWRAVAHLLHARHRAPRLRSWLTVPGGFEGPVFEWLDARPAGRVAELPRQELIRAVHALHRDDELADRLRAAGAAPASCAAVYLRTYHDRFVADLEAVGADPPPFVDDRLVAWLRDEVRALRDRVTSAPAFHRPAARPTHGDLWPDNILIRAGGGGRWHIVDWDELALADPVQDWAMLFGPSHADVRPLPDRIAPDELAGDAAERARLGLYAKASLLDWVIDPLADWVAADSEPDREAVRARNEATHRHALARYRQW